MATKTKIDPVTALREKHRNTYTKRVEITVGAIVDVQGVGLCVVETRGPIHRTSVETTYPGTLRPVRAALKPDGTAGFRVAPFTIDGFSFDRIGWTYDGLRNDKQARAWGKRHGFEKGKR